MKFTEETLSELSSLLRQAEKYCNADDTAKSVAEYKKVCLKYEEVKDFPTASYFYQKCLIMSKQTKYPEGEATSYMGLGLCEEGERNITKAQEYYETALEKALDKDLHAIVKLISEQLIRIYEKLAITCEESGDYQKTLDYYDKCLDASKRALNSQKEAECYYKLGMTFEKTKELEKSVEALEKFLSICEKTNNQVNLKIVLFNFLNRRVRVWP